MGRKQREKDASIATSLQDKMSLGLDILPEHEDDVQRAGFVEFGGVAPDAALNKAISKPLFKHAVSTTKITSKNSKTSKRRRAEDLAKQKTEAFAAEIRGNTRVAMDPFLTASRPSSKPVPILAGVKRKISKLEDTVTGRLVDYDSD